MQKSVTLDLRGTAGGLVDVVTLHGDEVARAVKVDTPVVVAVTGGGVVAGAVDEAVGDGHALGGVGTKDNVLATDAGGGDVVNPDHVGAVDGDGITTPDVLRVDLGSTDVLDDDVLNAASHTETLALHNTLGALADDRLVALDGDS